MTANTLLRYWEAQDLCMITNFQQSTSCNQTQVWGTRASHLGNIWRGYLTEAAPSCFPIGVASKRVFNTANTCTLTIVSPESLCFVSQSSYGHRGFSQINTNFSANVLNSHLYVPLQPYARTATGKWFSMILVLPVGNVRAGRQVITMQGLRFPETENGCRSARRSCE